MDIKSINRELGNADLFLIDQILKGFFIEGSVVLDAGCGEGRNLIYFLRNNFKVYGIDRNETALRMLRITGKTINPGFEPGQFIHGDILDLPFADDFFDYILCFSVLHHARDESEFHRMIINLTAALKTGGFFVIGMNSVFGHQSDAGVPARAAVRPASGGPIFALNSTVLKAITESYGLKLVEPLKTWITQGGETMSYMVMRKVDPQGKFVPRTVKGTDDPVN